VVGVNLSDMGEFGFLERMRDWVGRGSALVGLGDDAAVAELRSGGRIVATADALVKDVHFRLDWSSPADVGWKAVAVNVSDLAAMGAEPRWLLLTLCAPPDASEDMLRGMYSGMGEACDAYGMELVGGDTVRSGALTLAVCALGEIDGDPVRRSGAKVGDALAVTGPLGRAAAGVNLLLSQNPKKVSPEDAIECMDAHRRPSARVAEGRALQRAGAHAAIDVSDGLGSDVRRLCEASGVGAELDLHRLPVADEVQRIADARGWDAVQMVLGGGEDLELLVALPREMLETIDTDLIEVGRIVEDQSVWLVHNGEREELPPAGYDHFRT
jgi:thiamine-monophosphate kinase